jgi:hypothetical protein
MVGLAGSKLANGSRCSRLPCSDVGLIHVHGLPQQPGESAILSVELRIVPC